ncbi:MAG: AsmA family protein [Pseudomonadota bacterium]
MKRLFIGVLVIVVGVVVALAGVAMFVPADDVKTEIARQIRNNSGWNLRIDGDIDVGVFPGLRLEAGDVGLSGRAWADGLEFVSADSVSFGLSLFPLLTGSVEVSTIRLENPVFELEIDRNGQTSWDPLDLGPEGTPQSIEDVIGGTQQTETAESTPAPAETDGQAGSSGSTLPIENLRVGSLEVVNGTLSYLDRRTGQGETIEQIDLSASVPSLDSRSEIEGSLVWRGETVTLAGRIEALRALLETGSSELAADVETPKGAVSLEGVVAAGAETLFDGKAALSVPSMPDLVAWVTGSAAGVAELGPVSIAAPIVVSPASVRSENISLAVGDAKGSGSVDLTLQGERPKLVSRFAIDRLDIDAFTKADAGAVLPKSDLPPLIRASLERSFILAQAVLPRPNPRRRASPSADAETPAPPAASSPNAASAPPAAAAAPPPSVPATDAIDFSGLQAADAELDISVGEIIASGVSARDVGLTARLEAGVLTVDLREANVFGGKTGGNFVLDSVASVPKIEGDIKAANLNLASLAMLGGYAEPIDGALSADTFFRTSGRSVAEFVGALDADGTVSLRNGTLDNLPLAEPLKDPSAGRIDYFALDLRFAGRNRPIVAEGQVDWRGETFRLNASLTAAPLALGQAAPLKADLVSSRLSAGYDGRISAAGKADGAVSLSTPSLRSLLAWLNQPVPELGGLGPFAFKGRLAASPDQVSFDDARVTLDQTSGTGSGRIATGGAVPTVEARLSFDTLDLTPYLAGGNAGSAPSGQPGAPAAAPANAAPTNAPPQGGTAWSTAPIDVSGLRSVNATLAMRVEKLIADTINVGPAAVDVTLAGGVLTTNLTELGLYGGGGEAQLVVDAAKAPPVFSARGRVSGINAYPFLRDVAGFERIEGIGDVSFDLAASGGNEAALAASLDGVAAFQFRDGALRGINIPRMVRGLSTDILNGWQQSAAEKTDFSSLSASFTITDGVAVNNDLSMIGPLVKVAGAGTTSMPPRTLAWRVEPEVVGTLLGQGRSGDFAGFGVPIVIEGSWDSPRIYPDIAGILQNPGAAYDQLRQLGGGVFGGIDPLNGGSAEAAQERLKQRIEKQTGINVDSVVQDGKIDKDKAVDEAVKGIISIFGDRDR